jgi:hypothetical protein
MASFKPDYLAGAEKCRCLVLHNDRGALLSLLAMLLVQIRVQGEGEENPFVSDLQANFGTSYEPRRQGRLYRGTAEPTKEPKIPSNKVPSDPTPHCSGVRDIRTSGNEPRGNIRSYQVGIRNVSFGTGVW